MRIAKAIGAGVIAAGMAVGAGVIAAGMAVGTAGVASADEQGYLDWLDSHGYTYGVLHGTPSTALLQGQLICNNIRYSGDPRAGLPPINSAVTPDYLIEGAQRELCPDTL